MPLPANLPSPANPTLPLPSPISTVEVKPTIETGPDGEPRVVYSPAEHEKLMSNIGDAYRWIAEAMGQLNFYRNQNHEAH